MRLRRLAAITLAERITLVGRYVPTDRNMADSPSRGGLVPGPCAKTPLYAEKRNAVRPPYVRPRGRGLGHAAVRIGEASHPGPFAPLAPITTIEDSSEEAVQLPLLPYLDVLWQPGRKKCVP